MRIILLITLLSLCSCGNLNRKSSSNERKMKDVYKQDKIMFKKVMKARRRGARFVLKLAK
jgi:hypothetical protein